MRADPAEWLVDRMIRRTVVRRFRNVYWRPPVNVAEPTIFVPNHHGWHDGYLMYLALAKLNLAGVHDWIQEYDAFPLFGRIGGMPFPAGDALGRAATIRRTVRYLRSERHSLLLFAEGVLHRPPELLPFGKALDFLAGQVPEVAVVPVAIKYEHALHERPEAYLWFGEPVAAGGEIGRRTRLAIGGLLDRLSASIALGAEGLDILHGGTKDVNERLDLRKMPAFRRRGGN